MDKLVVISLCEDGSCCCIPARTTVAFISILSLGVCLLDTMTEDEDCGYSNELKEYVDSLKTLLVTMFEMANMLLLLATMVENALLVQIYVWYTMGFVILGLFVSLIDFIFRISYEILWTFLGFITEVAFLFVIFRCLPLVNAYWIRIEVKSR